MEKKKKRVSTKSVNNQRKKAYDQNKEVITWNNLSVIVDQLATLLDSYNRIGLAIQAKNQEKLKDLRARETLIGFFKLLGEHAEQLNKLLELHAVRDKDNNIKYNNNTIVLRTGICKSVEEMQAVANITMEYYNEYELVTELGTKVIPELATQFDVDDDIRKLINDMTNEFTLEVNKQAEQINQELKDM